MEIEHTGYRAGSIPASAGEPWARLGRPGRPEVYPRECGGTVHEPVEAFENVGLSPRVRGNPKYPLHPSGQGRSIPASAGEPHHHKTRTCKNSVYPRECGGTWEYQRLTIPSQGLSPRVRGNRCSPVRDTLTGRSIPASAGEPRLLGPTRCLGRVYPRECGGTVDYLGTDEGVEGLSPRVRGNLHGISKSVC